MLPSRWVERNPVNQLTGRQAVSKGVTVAEEKLKIACENARQNAAEENLFKQLRLCIWVKHHQVDADAPLG